MKDRRDYIIQKAMELYAHSGYSNVSITDLQIALDMGRGTMYYYFKDQDELFQTCMERYFLIPKQRAFSDLPPTLTVPEMIDAVLSYLNSLQEALSHFSNQNLNTSNVVNLMCTAYNRFPALYRKANRIYKMELDLWQRALRNSQRLGLVRRDIDLETTALLFVHIKDGYDSGRSGVKMDFSIFPKEYHFLYSLIKVPDNM